ncbi:phosphatidylethanolamine N-methyltransferase-like [Halichondria panicea]|uniref:phosphatidylethanolamine N-methyltransferase-like n=1 Tax=Halichondria panicea TaxID=6063 RepID=UPI00312BC1BE
MECVSEFSAELVQWKNLLPCIVVMLNPLFWNVVSRMEYKTHFISNLFGGPKKGVTALAIGILSMNYLRTSIFHKTIDSHGACQILQNDVCNAIGYLFITIGSVFVIASSYRLGFFCSFMGDYFGILLDSRVTGFPFNVVDDPMYVGSGLVYLGMAFQHASMFGFLLTGCIAISYAIALFFEGPFTAQIYVDASEKAKSQKAKSQ